MKSDPVIFSTRASSSIAEFIENKTFSGIAVLADENTEKYCLPLINSALEKYHLIRIKPGEIHKNLDTCREIWQKLTHSNFDRKSLMINLGGGVIGDMGGFCAATYKRGISFINIPTTLLAQVDASIGGKLGVDMDGLKNHIGIFRKPDLVIIDPVFLSTLPSRELRSGFAEVIKHALIADSLHWQQLKGISYLDAPWKTIIPYSVRIKSDVVEKDPEESGIRKILNFGHTIGHALETYCLKNKTDIVLHGEAVAAGMICETFLSAEIAGLPDADFREIKKCLLEVYGKISISKNDVKPITELLIQDKKNENNQLRFSLLERIGKCSFNIPVVSGQAEKAIDWYVSL